MGCVKLVFFMLLKLDLLEFKNMFTVNPNASDYCYDYTDQRMQSYPRTLFWNKSTDCCSWDGIHCDETTGQVVELDLRCSQLQGKFHSNSSLFQLSNLKRLDLSFNDFTGSLISPKFDLGSNNLEGTIPQCVGERNEYLLDLDLSNNRLSGTINTTFSIGNSFKAISLHGNKLTGKVPRSLINCKYLKLLDLGNNQLNDTFPNWLGYLSQLKILSLRSNKLHGPIKSSGSTNLFMRLQILDLSSNGFSGNLPERILGNLQTMKKIDENTRFPEYISDQYEIYYVYLTTITTKGQDYDSVRILDSNMIINLSKNRFEGHIPSIIGDLVGLRTLNLSRNALEGHIPASFQNLSVLESLDLSSNRISGEIPQQLASLTFLEVLNLSHNHLVGCIPKGKQFDSFGNTSYQGNDGLRGFPLSKLCGVDDQVTTPAELDQEEEEEDSPMISWQGVLVGYGCGLVIGLSVIYIMWSTQYPAWFSRMDLKLEHIITTRMKKHKKRY
uniref:Leucine-rich repeat-containing N-terminal plant-type domain-containing protein n=1 Tax=Solanum lycopersicum TaxID=4081 RepID=A0A3Q7E7Y2_SOLLC